MPKICFYVIDIMLSYRFYKQFNRTMEKLEKGSVQLKKVLTLVYLLNNDKVLLGLKKRGFGEGKVCHKQKELYQLDIDRKKGNVAFCWK